VYAISAFFAGRWPFGHRKANVPRQPPRIDVHLPQHQPVHTEGEILGAFHDLPAEQRTSLLETLTRLQTSPTPVALSEDRDRLLRRRVVDSSPSHEALAVQGAILYEEPINQSGTGAVTAFRASVVWRFIGGGSNDPTVEATLTVPERAMSVLIAFRRNTDVTLPASHLIEVTIDAPTNFHSQGIREVLRIVLKPKEDARGQPLVGAAAKVAPGLFWIALSANQHDTASNLTLLRTSAWIDLPLLYGTGQRAILTFEKGELGESAFEQAIAAWESAHAD
jgi:hypothetical protein